MQGYEEHNYKEEIVPCPSTVAPVFEAAQEAVEGSVGEADGVDGVDGAEAPGEVEDDDSILLELQRLKSVVREEQQSPSEDEFESQEASGSEDDDDDESAQASSGAYNSLLKSLSESAPSRHKRRKLDHPVSAENVQQEDSASADEEEDAEKDVDLVEEAEEEPEIGLIEDMFDDDDNEGETSEPFETHFASPDEKDLAEKLKAAEQGQWQAKRIATNTARVYINTPKTENGAEPSLPGPISGPNGLKLKKKLHEVIVSKRPQFDATEKEVAPLIFNYYDTLYCDRTISASESLRRMVALHALNHVFKTRDRVIKNNSRLSRAEDKDELELRDQGFTRPKVLMILPTRQSCAKMVEMIRSLVEPDQQENRKRFEDSYISRDDRFSDDKPADFRDLFSGNDDDMFRLGIKFTRKSIKYFAQFYSSDIILASPLGLRMAIGSEEDKKLDYDFLSSIELVVVDQADALLMQNWDHVEYIFEHLNLQPKDAHGCDFSRVRSWYLENQAKHFRQAIIFSAFNTPELSELFRLHCNNWAGKYRLQREYPGIIQHLGVKAKQTFCRFDSEAVAGDPDARFDYFIKAVLPTLTKRAKESDGTLIFIPSYLDFVRVRNYLANNPAAESLTFGTISEYADVPEASRARSHFLNGRHRVLLYTERAHHFRRYQVKGVKRVIMYGLPDNPIFYQEIAGGYLQQSEQAGHVDRGQGRVRVLFSRYDLLKLERVVGSQRVGKMLHERGDTFDFV
ncbi:DUF1253-domain-containing protein [Thozetella sp. PMI_491]|nr:DUF1253-domain-containing protein [Thozetella sp. PMI_491]